MTQKSIAKLKLEGLQTERLFYDFHHNRLALRLRQKKDGTYSHAWVYIYMFEGKRRKIYIGPYSKVSVKDAHTKAVELSGDLANGIDPAQEIFEAKEHSVPATFGDLYKRWFDEVIKKKRPKSHAHVQQIFRDHIFFSSMVQTVKLGKLKPHYIKKILDKIHAKGKLRTLAMALQLLKQLFTWAQDYEYLERNPARVFSEGDFGVLTPRDRYLDRDEIRQLIKGLYLADVDPQYVSALMLILATGNRSNETRLIKIKDINLEKQILTIPVLNQKKIQGVTKRPHVVHLSDFALVHVKKLMQLAEGSEYLLPHLRYENKRFKEPISRTTLLQQLARHDGVSAHSETSFLKLKGGRFTVHDLRRTMSSHMQELRVPYDVIDKCQNHEIPGKVRRIYMRGRMESRMKAAWNRLGRFLDDLQTEALNEPVAVGAA